MATNLTTVNIKKEFQKELRKLSQSWGISQVEFLNNAIWYFKKTGINPQSTIFSPKEEIAKLDKRLDQVIKFLRHQEKDKLSPLLDEIIITERRLKESLALGVDKDDFDSLQNHILEIKKLCNFHVVQNSETRKEIIKTRRHLNQVVILMFEAIRKSNDSGKFFQEDIDRFQDAVLKV